MASEMVERVARVMEEVRLKAGPYAGVAYVDLALAAIEEMRKPTTKMLNAAGAAMSPAKRPTPERVSDKAKHGIRYRAMIDAALKE